MRLETLPTPVEIVQAWVRAANGDVPSEEVFDVFDTRESSQSPIAAAEAVEEESPDAPLPDIKRVVRPQHAAGDLEKLFFSPVKAQIFDAFESELARKPNSRLVRAAAIAFYWQLSTYIPGEYMSYTGYTEDDGFDFEYEKWERDDSPVYIPIRRLFAAILGVIASYGKVKDIVSWAEAQWEMRNAYAASDWSRVRDIFDHIEKEKLQTPLEIAVLRFQFEGLLILGPYVDVLTPKLTAKRDDIRRRPFAFAERMSLEHLNVEPQIFDPSSRGVNPTEDLVSVPLFLMAPSNLPLPVIPLNTQATLQRVLADIQPHFSMLPERGLIQRTLAALLYEALGERHQAAEQYLLLSTQYDDYLGRGRSTLYKVKAVTILHQAGQKTRSVAKFRELLKERDILNPVMIADLAVSLGLLDEAKMLVSGLSKEKREALDPVLQAALAQEDGEPFRKSEEKCQAWHTFAKLSKNAQASWRYATLSLQTKYMADAIQSESERIAVEQYGRTVELELAEVFLQFRDYGNKLRSKWQADLIADATLKAFLHGGTITLGQMQFALRRITRGGGMGEIDRLLQRFLLEHCPSLTLRGPLEALDRLTVARNDACHQTTKVQPTQAQALARGIIEAIHLRA